MFQETDAKDAFEKAIEGKKAYIIYKRENGDEGIIDLTRKVEQLTEMDDARYIVNENDIPEETVKQVAEFQQAVMPKQEENKRRKITTEAGKRIMDLHDGGWTNSAIARSMGLSPATIGNYIKRMGGLNQNENIPGSISGSSHRHSIGRSNRAISI